MSTGGGTSQTTTVQELSPEQRALIEPVIPIAKDYLKNPPSMYPGSSIAGFNPMQQMAQQMTMNAAQGMTGVTGKIPQQLQALMGGWGGTAQTAGQQGQAGQQQMQQILQAIGGAAGQVKPQINQTLQQGAQQTAPGLGFLTSGDVLSPGSNPALQGAIEAASRPVVENFQRNVLPSITQEGIASGGYGGTRQGIAEGIAGQALNRQVGDIASTLSNQNYQSGLQAMLGGLNTSVAQTGQQVSGQLGAQGAQNQLLGQLISGNLGGQQAAQGWLGQQQAGLGGAQSLLGQQGDILKQTLMPGQAVEAVGTQQQMMEQAKLSERVQRYINEQMIPFSAAQDVAAMAFGMPGGSTVSRSTGASNPMAGMQMGLGAVAALPALLGKSDRRLKHAIRKVGELLDGLSIYVFRYFGEIEDKIGLMADEVRELYPNAVVRIDNFDHVNYLAVPTWIGKRKDS